MKKEDILELFEQFEQAACEVNNVECWSACELQKFLGYSLWQNFSNVINKAKDSCMNVGQSLPDHFIDSIKWWSWEAVHFEMWMTSCSPVMPAILWLKMAPPLSHR